MKVVDQNIPAELYNQYVRTLGQAQVWIPGSSIRSLSKRDWYELIHRASPPRGAPSAAQLKVRAAFLKCVDCFNAMPKTGGVEPPAIGYRSKEWWYTKSLDPPEQNWKKTEMVTWAGWAADPYQLKDTNYDYHNANWFLKTDEQDFIDFYNEMKPKYGYPWSAKNDPDQIVTKMNQIVCDEIDYDHEGDMTVCFTPGQTAQARKGVCDDQSALHYALTWKALKELEWTDNQINNRLACVIVDREDNRHMYNWWKSNAGGTKIIENTYDPGESPKVIGGMKYWGDDHAKFLIQKFAKSGHFEPVWTYPEIVLPLWYYNYFIKYSWAIFYDDDIPDWCVGPVLDCELYDARYKMGYGKDDNAAVARQESWDDFTGKDWGSTESQQCLSYSKWVKYPWSYYRYYKYVWKAKYRIDLTNYSKGSYSSALLVIIPETIPLFDVYYCPFGWDQDSRNVIIDITSYLGGMYEPDIYFPAEYFNFWPEVDADYMGYKAFPKVFLTSKHPASE